MIAATDRRRHSAAWVWLFPITYVIHVTEEYWAGEGFLHWLTRVARVAIPATEFAVLMAIGLVAMMAGVWLVPKRFQPQLALVLASFAAINTLVHVAGTLLTGSYSPGLISALTLWVPLAAVAIGRSCPDVSGRQAFAAAMLGMGMHAAVLLLVLR